MNLTSILIILALLYVTSFVFKKHEFPIDMVYTWAGDNNRGDIRTDNNNELEYSLKSVCKYMPWINHIFVLTGRMKDVPIWLQNDKITIVYKEDLLSFDLCNAEKYTNSNAIETILHKIPNLSEHFIYMNDDFFIGSKVYKHDFFTIYGKPKVSQHSSKPTNMNKTSNDPDLPKTVNQFYPHMYL